MCEGEEVAFLYKKSMDEKTQWVMFFSKKSFVSGYIPYQISPLKECLY